MIKSTFTVNNSTWKNNSAGTFGGGLVISGLHGGRMFAFIYGSVFSYNEAQVDGGGVILQDMVSVEMSHNIFTSNRASGDGNGGGVYLAVRA